MNMPRNLEGEAMIYFGPERWEGLWRNRHQLMVRFARTNTVMYVEPRIFVRTLYADLRSKRIRLADFFRPLSSQSHGVHVFHSPLWLPSTGKPGLSSLLTWLWRKVLRRSMKKAGIENPIIWLSRPEMIEYLHRFGEKLSIYHVVDEYSEYYGLTPERRKVIKETERRLIKSANLCVVVSAKLYEGKCQYSDKVHLVPNAVDYEAFHAALGPPSEMADIAKPVIGYSGLISDRLNLRLLAAVADAHPDWSIVLVGDELVANCGEELAALGRRANVHFLGRKTVEALPAYINAFDVGIIPYRTDENADNCSPLKMYEYMAAAKPIVTTDFAVAREYSDVVYVASDEQCFDERISEALRHGESRRRIHEGECIAAENTWAHRVQAISDIVRYELDES
jgi:glycosyltransferase involved in cell wall biosynthesis